jgi:amino acid transporter
MANLFAKKPLAKLMAESQEVGEHSLKRSLGPINLIALGIGGIIGAGLFVRTAAAIADRAGPSVVLAFILAGIGCAFAGLCYAEFASMIPVAGSAYTYSYATMGELVAWIIGWDLILEYAVAASTVSIAWSEYANRVLEWFKFEPWNGSSINTLIGGADTQDLPMSFTFAVVLALAALIYFVLAKWRSTWVGAWRPAVIGVMFLGAWFALDARWLWNFARQAAVTAELYAGKPWRERHLVADDAAVFAFMAFKRSSVRSRSAPLRESP